MRTHKPGFECRGVGWVGISCTSMCGVCMASPCVIGGSGVVANMLLPVLVPTLSCSPVMLICGGSGAHSVGAALPVRTTWTRVSKRQ